jgi:hypothetical protein
VGNPISRVSQVDQIVSALAALLGGLVTAGASYLTYRAAKDSEPQPPSERTLTLEDRIDLLQQQMKASAILIEQISAEMDARAKTAASLKAEAEQAQQLASLHEEQQKAVVRAVRAEMTSESKRTARRNLVANIMFFLGGVLVSVAIQLLIKPL